MKKRKKFYHPIHLPGENYTIQGTLMEVLLILLIGIIAVVYLGYKYYVQPPPKPVEVPQEGSILPTDLTEAQGARNDSADDFQVVEIQPKQVTLDRKDQAIVLRLPSGVLLNAKRR